MLSAHGMRQILMLERFGRFFFLALLKVVLYVHALVEDADNI